MAFLRGDYRRLINEGNVQDYAADTLGCTNHEKAALSVIKMNLTLHLVHTISFLSIQF